MTWIPIFLVAWVVVPFPAAVAMGRLLQDRQRPDVAPVIDRQAV